MNQYNGKVNIMGPNIAAQFSMMDKIPINTNTNYQNVLAGNFERSQLSTNYFSKNNIDLILEAFKDAKLKLILIGNWAFSKYGIDLKDKYKSFDNLVLLDPIYDQRTLDELRSNCGLYVHGHSVGGTNPSLVEAMNLGLCSAVFNVDYNRETTENSALYFVDIEELKGLISDFLNNKINSELIGSNLKSIAIRRYTWVSIVAKYEQLFK